MAPRRDVGPLGRLFRWMMSTGNRRYVTAVVLVIASLLAVLIFSIVVSINSLFVSGEQNPLGQ